MVSHLFETSGVIAACCVMSEDMQCEKKEERNLRTELRPSLRLTEPGGEESEPHDQKDDAKRNPHDQPRELLILQSIETGSG